MSTRSTTAGKPASAARQSLAERLFAWHEEFGRDLLIRDATTPWEVLVAEVMSHQTQIGRVGPAWRHFVDTWRSPAALAAAGTHDLLAAWAGLGYNRRALALRDAARRIVVDHAGVVPATIEALDALPGIGPYTARAIAATAFGVPVAPLDVNVRRVVSRVTGIDARAPELQAAGDGLVSREEPRRWLNAVMDLASETCTRVSPRCGRCPLAEGCVSRGAVGGGPAGPTSASVPFPETTRWLRGRLIALLTSAPPGSWLPLPGRLGTHDRDAIVSAASSLDREGFLEVREGFARLRA